ncbi:DUF1090 domain-containing protein [Marinobacter sp. V034]|uniref:DUF1090 domain-containing protein n=1 Tax=Marinobacter sp. V034 TaxID=3459610 RepID=UPI004044871D
MTTSFTLATSSLLLIVVGVSTSTLADDTTPALRDCSAKIAEIQTQLDHANAQGNQSRIAGLERALAGAQNCDDQQLRENALQDIEEAKAKVRERRQELQEEREDGDADDIRKAERKLREAEEELAELARPAEQD